MGKVEDLEQVVEEQKEEIDGLRGEIDTLSNMVIDLSDRMNNTENGEVPAHNHITNRIHVQNLTGGFETLNSTPTHSSEDGRILFYTVGSTSYIATKIAKTWKKAELSNV